MEAKAEEPRRYLKRAAVCPVDLVVTEDILHRRSDLAAARGHAVSRTRTVNLLGFVVVAFGNLLCFFGAVGFLVRLTPLLLSIRQLTRREFYDAMFWLMLASMGFVLAGGHLRGPPAP